MDYIPKGGILHINGGQHMIYKIAAIGFGLFVLSLCYCLTVVAKMADEEEEERLRDLWMEQEKGEE